MPKLQETLDGIMKLAADVETVANHQSPTMFSKDVAKQMQEIQTTIFEVKCTVEILMDLLKEKRRKEALKLLERDMPLPLRVSK